MPVWVPRCQKIASDISELELQAAVNHQMKVLGMELRPLEEQHVLSTKEPSLPPLLFIIINLKVVGKRGISVTTSLMTKS